MKSIWLTGGSGMVGRNIQEHPATANWRVLAPTSTELDLTDAAAVALWVAREKPDLVIHAAGQVGGIHANIAHPVDFLTRNVMMGQNVILGAWRAGVRALINLGSTCMYPRGVDGMLSEDMILTGELEPTNEGYAIAKILAARLCQYIRREDQQAQYKTLIPCNLYGRHDKFDPMHSHLVPAVIHKIHLAKVNGEPTVEIWGDGTARREFIYAGDLADAVMRAADNVASLPDLMNIGLGHDHTINEYYAAAADVVGWTGTFTHDLTRPVGMRRKLSNCARQSEWGWTPSTSLTEGLGKTYDFYLETVAR
jgi:GDP-L-fucose synthase